MFRLANLRNWKDRSFSLSDENDWLDLLDDFGPALPRFLLDDSCASSIPADDGALEELRQSLVKHPVSSLKPDIGSVWVLFAFKEDLQGLPPPFRQDGLLLPFEWRKGEADHSRLLPEELTSLAELVKGQFGKGAADCTLHPSRHFLDAVDFHIPGATFDSAWGALATGLHLLLSRKKHLTAWPFSSIAYDFTSGTFAAVGELERKFLLAASCGAEEIAVAPVQYKEAKTTLLKLHVEHPNDKTLKRLAIYHWRTSGDLRRSVVSLARCNQSGRQRRMFFGFVIAICVCIVVLAICASGYVYDWRREKVAYFRDYVDRFGIPHGLFQIGEAEVGSRPQSYRFHFQGYDGYLPWRRKPVLRSVYCVDSRGRPVNDAGTLPLHPKVAGRKFTYGESGRLVEMRNLRPNGYETDIFRIAGASDEFIDVTRRGHDGQWGTPEWGAELVRGGRSDKLRRLLIKRDTNGFVLEVSFLKDSKGIPVSIHGIGRETYTLDELGRAVTRKTYSCDGKQTVGEGAKGDEFHYAFDKGGDLASVAVLRNGEVVDGWKCDIGIKKPIETPNKRYGEFGELVEERLVGKAGNIDYIVRYTYDVSLLHRVETDFFDSNGNPTNNPDGWSVHTIKYQKESDSGETRRIDSWFDAKSQPVNTRNGYAAEIATFDSAGRCVKLEIFGSNGENAMAQQGYHCAKYEYDQFGFVSSQSYFGTNGEPVVANLEKGVGYHALHMLNDENGNILEATTYGTNGIPMNIPSRGYAREHKTYDAKNRLVECTFYDKDDRPAAPIGMSGAWRHRTIYNDAKSGGKDTISYKLNGNYTVVSWDQRGLRTKEAYFSADGTPRVDDEGVASVTYRYDDKGNQIKREYWGADDKRTLTTELIAGIETIYSEYGDEIENRRFGLDQELKLDRNGVAIVEMTYDENHRMVAKDFYGVTTNRTANITGDYGMRWEYDERGNQTASYSIGRNGKCRLDVNGVGIVRYEYDALGRIIKRRFYDVDDKPTRSNEGIGGWYSEYDNAGNETCRRFFDENEKPCMFAGRFGWRMQFDEHKRVIEEESLDCTGNVAAQKLSIDGIEMSLGSVSYSYGRDGRKIVIGESFGGEMILGGVRKVKVTYTRDGDIERIEFMNEADKLVNSSALGYARKESKYNEFREMTEESYWDAEGKAAIALPEKIHKSVVHYKRTKAGLILDFHSLDAEGFHAIARKTGFARCIVKYDAQGRLLSFETFDAQNKPKTCGKCSKLIVTYDTNGEPATIFMEDAGDCGDVAKMKLVFRGSLVECSLLDGENEVKERKVQEMVNVPKEFLNLGYIRYSVDANRRPAQIVVPHE